MGHFFAVDCMIWWVTTTLTHWGQVYIDYGKGLLLVRFQAITWNWYCHINEIRTQWVEDHSIHCMYIYSWNWFLIVLNTAIKDFELNWNWIEIEALNGHPSRSHGTKNRRFWPEYWAFADCDFSLNSPMALKWCMKLDTVEKRCPIVFQCHLSNFKVTRVEKSTIWIQFK